MRLLTWKYSLIKAVGLGTERECFPPSPFIKEKASICSEIPEAMAPEEKMLYHPKKTHGIFDAYKLN